MDLDRRENAAKEFHELETGPEILAETAQQQLKDHIFKYFERTSRAIVLGVMNWKMQNRIDRSATAACR